MSVIQFFIFVFCSHTPPFAETIPPAGNPRISISAVPSDIRNSAVNTFRWNQQTSEITANPVNYNDAVKRLSGGDKMTSRVWWDK